MSETQNAKGAPLQVLVVDDEESFRSSLALNLKSAGYEVTTIPEPVQALKVLSSRGFDIILCDLNLPGMSGIEFTESCQELDIDTSIVLMTGFGSHELALEALRKGAYDYISKPFEIEELIFLLRKIEEKEQLRQENAALRSELDQTYNFSSIIAKSKPMQEVFETVKRLAQFHTSVLITGQSGTGKELLARAIHYNSPRRDRPFVAINCGAIPENLMESELFGHKRGAFTDAIRDKVGLFEEADGGTLFLDEIGEMPLHLQVKILRALQERVVRPVGSENTLTVDVRVIAATLRDLDDDVLKGRFRDDLYYRLNVVAIHLPTLKERPEDIPVLTNHFVQKLNKKMRLSVKGVTSEAMKCLLAFEWRGNIRELENCIERAMVLTDGDLIVADVLPQAVREAGGGETKSMRTLDLESDISIKRQTRLLERQLIQKALERTGGNRTHAAKILEISHRALLYKIKEYGLADCG